MTSPEYRVQRSKSDSFFVTQPGFDVSNFNKKEFIKLVTSYKNLNLNLINKNNSEQEEMEKLKEESVARIKAKREQVNQ